MSFPANAEIVARDAMTAIDSSLVGKFVTLIRYLVSSPHSAALIRGRYAPEVGSKLHIERLARIFVVAREPRAPAAPATVPDEMVSLILQEYFGIPAANLARAKEEHALSMGAENMVGDLLERYIASVAEPLGWIWCSGSIVKAVDFIKPPALPGGPWTVLQIKNRDNSENSSSSAIRIGTLIEKWHRTFSKKAGSNWNAFPDAELRPHLCEEGFRTFVKNYLRALKT
ncbi:SinI family restriction endonuclease [Massilia sp. Leaf139]|uniref:SinI family restriction endonuclease n=1 Tax=Massilia sp. Leaf139 TaxID=1736272 RepID=UPI0006FDFEF7|nr:SinI family restriction endonuclease [Massilia sp. Leaf139]KQQ94956.1 restriction endonuclease [Massilia sp. Leaf139]